ncbi:unnamed protein product [Calicophoron daubneyi]|uniref:phosphatidate phosphatase n=1 Tax=Calicophoron daubneyi TaxID=300641 RepID=A0AAV2T9J1_CALDB
MSWSLGRLFSGLKGAYNDINPSTLTGAIDVIVVQQKDGTFSCGPFHVRFGKLTAISPADKIVEVYVNGMYVDFLRMRLGSAGDAYFVDGDGFSSSDENEPSPSSESEFFHSTSWPLQVSRRRRRKFRRDSAMSEPDGSSTECGNLDAGPQSDSEQIDPFQEECSLFNHYASDSVLNESFKSATQELGWIRNSPVKRSSERPSQSGTSVSNPNDPCPAELQSEDSGKSKNGARGSGGSMEGVYLEDLIASDQTLRETYIYPPAHPVIPTLNAHSSVPSRYVDGCCVDAGYRSDYEHSPRSTSPIYPSVFGLRLSLCGCPPAGTTIPEEKFFESLVSYEEFIRDPENIVSNPNLTLQLNGKYFNWQVAAPMILSILAFQTELPHLTVRRLESTYMPKKQPRRTWFSWRSRHADAADNSPPQNSEDTKINSAKVAVVTCKDTHNSEEITTSKTYSRRMSSKCNRLSSETISRLHLKPGSNDIEFHITTKYQGTCICSASIFVWHWSDKIVVSDVDGTITRSDLLGHLLPMLGKDWTHDGVAKLYSQIAGNGYRFLYLSARALGQAGITRSYLRQVVQESNIRLPDGPILLSPDSLLHALHQEVIVKKPETFKIKCLSDVCSLFPEGTSPLYAGFGNKINDVYAYQESGIQRCRIFTVNPRSEVRNEFQNIRCTSYGELSEMVDLYFPATQSKPLGVAENEITVVNKQTIDSERGGDRANQNVNPSCSPVNVDLSEFSSFTYWRTPDFERSFQDTNSQGRDSSGPVIE